MINKYFGRDFHIYIIWINRIWHRLAGEDIWFQTNTAPSWDMKVSCIAFNALQTVSITPAFECGSQSSAFGSFFILVLTIYKGWSIVLHLVLNPLFWDFLSTQILESRLQLEGLRYGGQMLNLHPLESIAIPKILPHCTLFLDNLVSLVCCQALIIWALCAVDPFNRCV